MIEMNTEGTLKAIESGEKVLLDFYTPSCGGCKVLAYQLEKAEETLDIPVIKVNAETNESLASKFGVMKVPQIILVENGKELKRHIGFLPSEQIIEFTDTTEEHE